jgi:radical SAM-linked protein
LPLVIKFKVWGALRFLSHAETLRLFQRACVRAGMDVRYSQGFNPRPKLSLPLPRPVGVESDEEVLSLRCSIPDARSSTLNAIRVRLSPQLPEGCELLSVGAARSGASIQPRGATYALPLRREYLTENLRATVDRLLASESLVVERRTGARNRRSKNIDVRPFLASIEMTGQGIIVECRISTAGSIRVEEVLSLLQLDQNMLAGPIRRTSVRWQ